MLSTTKNVNKERLIMTTMSAQEYNVFSVKTGEHKDYIKAYVYCGFIMLVFCNNGVISQVSIISVDDFKNHNTYTLEGVNDSSFRGLTVDNPFMVSEDFVVYSCYSDNIKSSGFFSVHTNDVINAFNEILTSKYINV